MTACPDEASILSFGRGEVPVGERANIESHLAGCEECRVLVSAVRRASFVDPTELGGSPRDQEAPLVLAPPTASPVVARAMQAGQEVQAEVVAPPASPQLFGRVGLALAFAAAVVVLVLGVRFATSHRGVSTDQTPAPVATVDGAR